MTRRSPNRSPLSWTRVRTISRRRMLALSGGAALLAACGSNDDSQTSGNAATPAASGAAGRAASECVTVAHDGGETKVCGTPQKVAALSAYMLDMLLSLGVQPAAFAEVGIAQIGSTNVGAPIKQVKYLGDRVTSNPVFLGERSAPSVETLLRVRPELILGELGFHKDIYDQLSGVAPTLLFSGSKRDEWQRCLPPIALALGDADGAERVVEAHRQRIAAARSELAPAVTGKSVLLLASAGIAEPFFVWTADQWAGGLMEDIGIQLVTVPDSLAAGQEAGRASMEILPQLSAGEIIVMASGQNTPDNAAKEWEQSPVLRSLPASKAGRVHFVDYQLWSRIRGPIAAGLVIEGVQRILTS